ncbi:MAG: ABC transporter substrate-binding protein [Pseudomonadota bacterium]
MALGATVVANPLDCLAQPVTRVRRIGILAPGSAGASVVPDFRRVLYGSLGRAGYEIGRDIFVEWRFAEGKLERLSELADDLVRLNVDVIVAWNDLATEAAARATRTIPIVMYAYNEDPVKRGLAASLARPGGNVTGAMWFVDLVNQIVKTYEVLKLAVPSAVRVASLWSPWIARPKAEEQVAEIHDRVKRAFGMVVTSFVVDKSEEIPSALDRISAFKPDALFISSTTAITPRSGEIAAFAIRQKLVLIGSGPQVVTAGGLLYFGPDRPHVIDRTVSFVDRILRGAKPGDLPIEQPAKFELVFNARTARAIGYSPPPELRLRIDRVIE